MSAINNRLEPEPHWLNKSNMAKSLGISTQAFDKWDVKPVAKVGRSVYYSVNDVLQNRVTKEIEKHQPKPVEVDQLDPSQIEYERYRLTKAQADSQELKNEIAEGKVVPTEFATFALAKVAAAGVGILDGLPTNIQRKHPDITTVQLENIRRELAKTSNTLAELSCLIPELINEFIAETTE